MFNLDKFEKENLGYRVEGLNDFLITEIRDEECRNIIVQFLELENFRSGEYEGNIYMIHKIDVHNVVLIDLILEEVDGKASERSRCKLKVVEILDLIKNYTLQTTSVVQIDLPTTIYRENYSERKKYLGEYAERTVELLQDVQNQIKGFTFKLKP